MTALPPDVRARYEQRYLAQSRFFSRLDRTLAALFGNPAVAQPGSLPAPGKLLVCNYGHIGDMLITLSLLPAIKQAFPNVQIGVLSGSWNKSLLDGNPSFAHVHYLDHWYLVRGNESRLQKVASYTRSLIRTLRELKAVQYDTAIDIRLWFPNAIPVLWKAGIPVRVGYDRVGFAPLLTHLVPFEYDGRHERKYQAAPFRSLSIAGSLLDQIPDKWLRSPGSGLQIIRQHAPAATDSRYVILHPGASTVVRNWTESGWCEIARRSLAVGAIPVLTGLGA